MSSHDEGPRSGPRSSGSISSGNTLRELAGLQDAPAPLDSGDLTGSVFGRFRIESILGKGGMGVVYLAADAALERQVALKVLSVDLAEDPDHRKRLLREARAAAALSHPNIAAVYEMGDVDGRLYIAMEHIAGESLRQKIDRGPIVLPVAVELAKQILRGVAKAHEAGIVHRDIKPDNIMLTTDGVAKVLDFGIAKFLIERRDDQADQSTTATEHGRLLGTPSYMSPEQANAATVDARSDVFSFGIVFYEMLTGKTPFRGKNFLDVLASLARDEPKPPSEINGQVGKDVEEIVLRCLRKDPQDRYANAGDVLRALEGGQTSEKVEKTAELSSGRRLSSGAIVVAVAIASIAGVAYWKTMRSSAGPISTTATLSISAANSSAAPIPTPITGHPSPKSEHEGAVTAYREGLQALRDGAYIVAHTAFNKAIELDPTLGAAYVRLVVTSIWHAPTPEDARRAFRKAISYRTKLDERDRLLLDALEPIIQREPPDTEEAARRLRQASERFPGDAEFLAMQSLTPFAPNISPALELELSDRCLKLDPNYADCWQPRASALFRLGRMADADRATDHCLQVSPAANDCIADRMEMHALFGRCADMAEDARRIIANDTNDWETHRSLATALLAQGRSTATVRTTLDRGWDKAPEATKERWTRFDDIHFALLEGRFDDAEKTLLAWKLKQEKNPFEEVHRLIARDFIVLYEARGRTKDAAKIAEEYLSTREAWVRGFVRSGWHDPSVWFSRLQYAAAMISKETYTNARAAWIATWEKRLAVDMRPIVWFQAYAIPARDEKDALEALAILPHLQQLEYYQKRPTQMRAALGKVYLLAGRPAEAEPYLTQAAADCRLLYEPVENTVTHYYLAKARDALKNTDGACQAYGVVLSRWGKNALTVPMVEESRKAYQRLACQAP